MQKEINYSLLQKLQKSKKIQNELMKKNFTKLNSIRYSYDIRAGRATVKYKFRKIFFKNYINEITSHLKTCFPKSNSFLDCGAGDLVTTTLLYNKLAQKKFCACDFSLGRLYYGKKFFDQYKISKNQKLTIINSQMDLLPFENNSFDTIMTFNSLEPNGGSEKKILVELFRVAKKGLFLVEPLYERSNDKQKKRMDKLGYIKNIEKIIRKLGGKIFYTKELSNQGNSNNKSTILGVRLDKKNNKPKKITLCEPKTHFKINKKNNFYYSKKSGFIYPILSDIPIFNQNNKIFFPAKTKFIRDF
jgi:ubiquinone/menaquinone biosynthesis C-methylase UbiE